MQTLCGLVVFSCLLTTGALAQNSTNPLRPYDPDLDTLLLYHLEEGSGGVVNSYAPSFDGVIVEGKWVDDGRFGSALSFDGNGRIDVARSTRLITPDLTFELWVYQEQRAGPCFLIDSVVIEQYNPNGRLLAIDQYGRPIAMAMRAGSAPSQAVGPPIPLNRWVHLSASFRASRSRLELAVDGHVVASDFLPDDMEATDRMRIANSLFIEDRGFVGKIDEVRISSVARRLDPVAISSVSWSALKTRW